MSKWQEQKRMVLEAALEMVNKSLVVGTSGNVSLRLPPEDGRELLAITPSSRHYDLLTADDIPVIDFDGEPVEGGLAPSSETMLHIGIYRARKKVNAVLHTHSVFASALSVAGLEIPAIIEDQLLFIGGEVKLAGFALAGSRELADNAVAALGESNAVLLSNHGAVGVGRTMREAVTVCELLEKTAKIYFCSLALGRTNILPAEVIEAGKAFFAMLQSGSE
ncbi:MAG: class II aldolase/adducin family protein [Chloroflexi bacterium]|nr:class II aldolase/adducin family protein [Chloroflexota bacterium]